MPLTCRVCNASFELSPEEKAGYAKFGYDPIPECFDCQQQHKLSFRNGRCLYRRTCDATGKSIVSIYAPNSPYTVYESEYWYGDKWDALSYGRDFDFNRPFFEQFKELHTQVPRMALLNANSENSDFCNMTLGNKDCYFVIGGDYNDGVLYGTLCMHNKSSVDCDYGNHNELCYDLFESFNCYGCRSIIDSKNCSDCAYVSDCIGCHDCILCVNLHNKQYCIGNEELTKEEYMKKKQELLNGSYSMHLQNLQALRDMRSTRIVKFMHTISCENCTGDYMENSKNSHNSFFASECEDVTDCFFVLAKDCFRCTFFGHNTDLCYDCMSCPTINRCKHCYIAFNAQDCEYCDTVIHSKNCFGCCGLNHKQYCIFNKQYTKEEYETLKEKLIAHMKKTGEWGEFFPKDIGCFAYNESTAPDFYPLSKEEALSKGFRWRDEQEAPPDVSKIIDAAQLPDEITDIPDDVLNWAIRCEKTNRPFRIIKQELAFYRTHNIPFPRLHPDERYSDRMAAYCNKPKLYDRECMNCGKALRSTYSPERPEIVYCEECYLQSVY